MALCVIGGNANENETIRLLFVSDIKPLGSAISTGFMPER